MNLIDRVVAAVNPVAGMKRVAARAALDVVTRTYDGAGKGRRVANWRAPSSSANTAIGTSIPVLRDRARDLVRNNCWAQRAVGAIAANLVGPGIRLQARGGDAARLEAIEQAWKAWGETTECDADRRLNWYGIQRLVARSVVESGEALVRRRWRRAEDGLAIPLQLQVLEADFLDTSRDTLGRGTSPTIIHGIQFDAIGRREGYWLFGEHPGEGRSWKSTESRFVPASEIVHVFRLDRPGQVSGVTWLAPALLKLRELKEYDDAELVRQKIAACFAAFVTRPADEDGGAPTNEKGELIENVSPGMVDYLEPGEEITFAAPPGSSHYDPYVRTQLRAVATAMGMPYEVLAQDYSQVNFSSGRMGWIEFGRNLTSWRRELLLTGLCQPVWEWAREGLDLAGLRTTGVTATWTEPRREMIDPTKEVKALVDAVRGGVKSWDEVILEQGGDPEEKLAEHAKWQKRLDELGVVLEADARRGRTGVTAGAPVPDESEG
jgi:lambda family phage portal protein